MAYDHAHAYNDSINGRAEACYMYDWQARVLMTSALTRHDTVQAVYIRKAPRTKHNNTVA